MADEYLWSGKGAKDDEVARLERLLAPLGHDGRPLVSPADRSAIPARRGARRWLVPALAAAAALALLAAVGAWWLGREPARWEVTPLAGVPRVGDRALTTRGAIARGEWLVTGAGASARLRVGRIGVVDVDPHSRVRLLGTGGADHRLALAEGSLLAIIDAPPRRFFVETPSALATDLGCAYTIEVDARGDGMLTVEIGWVSMGAGGRESFIPAGGRCRTFAATGPGTPYFTDASAAFKNALIEFDTGVSAAGAGAMSPDSARAEGLRGTLAAARREDGFTLWHLLARTEGEQRAAVFEALAARVPPPAGVTRAGILAGDRAMRDTWWDALGYGGTRDWRRWQRPWGAVAHPG